MKQKSSSIQKKLVRLILSICGSVLLLTCAAFFVYEYLSYRQITKRELETLGQITATNVTSSLAFLSKDDATELLKALHSQKNIIAACVYDKEGKIFAAYPNETMDFPPIVREDYHFREGYLEGFQPVVQEGTRLGTLYLRSDLKAVYNRFALYGLIGLVIVGVLFLFAFVLSRRLQGTIVNPILQLAGKAKIVSDKRDYSVRAKKKNDDELGVLTDAFNHMLTQIEEQNAEIVALNANLEQKIEQRTAQLQEANLALHEQNNFIQTIIDSSIDLIAVFDKELRFLVLNKKADKLYQRPREELLGKNVLQLFPQLKNSPFMVNLQRAFEGEFIHEHAYKSLVSSNYFENFFIPLTDENNVVDRVLVIGHDITSIMQANEKLKQVNAELEKSNHDLEQFAYVASHDLQEPLRKIKTFSELSERNTQHPEILKRYLSKIGSSATRMTDLIKAVLNYSRLSRTESEPVAVDLNNVIRQVITDLELYIEEKKALIRTEPLPVVKGIPLQLNQLFLNLFTNALKFSEKQPVITIQHSVTPRNAFVQDSLQKDENTFLKICFADNGIGFDQEYAEKVFSIFQRLHPIDKYAGTGIGLALCKKIVENHGGCIDVESKTGEGTTFFIYLPYDAGLQDAAAKSTKETNKAS
ncbi:ATP-binding protein [Flavisolibacter ginsenosidimutans]|uniref:histidine kinase n=1 Tax=Flavisolibacter ginsenosidimutans TaxID=661481 RepID=A0A5B8UN75_9BACT|nr:ATP-binding protein [Flavisolibacter ginsenosidimutans]QEC57896.1 HAMP domain-containing protein [Flavisolibacter ginsenosidimutans]